MAYLWDNCDCFSPHLMSLPLFFLWKISALLVRSMSLAYTGYFLCEWGIFTEHHTSDMGCKESQYHDLRNASGGSALHWHTWEWMEGEEVNIALWNFTNKYRMHTVKANSVEQRVHFEGRTTKKENNILTYPAFFITGKQHFPILCKAAINSFNNIEWSE